MALQKAFNVSIRGTTIDANEDNVVSWQVSGDISTAFKIDVLLNSDNSLAWTSNQITSYALKYTIPHGSLTNGIEYKIKITIYNQAAQSMTTDGDIFQTSSRPVVTVDAIGTVGNSSNLFTAQYTQLEGVSLRNYIVNLYDSNKNLINNSVILTSLPMQYLFDNLQTGNNYYIEFQATSSQNLTGTSGLVLFSVFYYQPKQHVDLTAINIANAGIELSWFVRQIIGSSDTTVNYLNGEEVDLTNGNRIFFDTGFSINQDFSLKVWLRGFENNVPLLTLTGDNGQIVLKYNAVQQAFVVVKTTTYITDNYESNSTIESSFVSPYQVDIQTGENAVVLIQQIGMDINLSVTMYT